MPERVQLSRRKGWRKPENTVVVARPSRWGNPVKVGGTTRVLQMAVIIETGKPEYAYVLDRTEAVALYRAALERRVLLPGAYPHIPTIQEIRSLAGKNLACWCPLDQPCHADVLLEIANGGAS